VYDKGGKNIGLIKTRTINVVDEQLYRKTVLDLNVTI